MFAWWLKVTLKKLFRDCALVVAVISGPKYLINALIRHEDSRAVRSTFVYLR